jgi:hypothetical protein
MVPRLAWLVAIGCGAPRAAAPAAPPPCPRAIDGLGPLIEPGAVLLLGEVHGTVESPRFLGDAACLAARRAPVTVALEIPEDEQPRLDAFLADPASSRDALLAGDFWGVRDGRSSLAMLDLLERLRAERAAGLDVAVLAFDQGDGPRPPGTRDQGMAARIAAAIEAAPGRTFLVYAGNVHTARSRGVRWDPAFEPAGYALAARGVALVSLDVGRHGGGFWACVPDQAGRTRCGDHDRPAEPVDRIWYVELAAIDGYDGTYVVGPTSASPPARPVRR